MHPNLTPGRLPRPVHLAPDEFKALVRRLQVRKKDLAAWLGVCPRTLRYWLSGAINAPKSVVVILQVVEVHMGNAPEPI